MLFVFNVRTFSAVGKGNLFAFVENPPSQHFVSHVMASGS
jgi:hypothetical protein